MSEYSRIELEDNSRLRVPKGEDPEAASAILNAALERSLVWVNELRAIANEYFDAAPASSEHASSLTGAIARLVGEWIEQWSS